jgi:hypothetical protein
MALSMLLGTFLAIGPPVYSDEIPVWSVGSQASSATGAAVDGQNPDERLATLLKHWQDAEISVKDVRKSIHRVYHDRIWRSETITHIDVIGKKPNLLRYELKDAMNRRMSLA